MPTLDIITVNIWSILVSLANLVILFLIVKKFFYKPVKSMLDSRKAKVEKDYADASEAKQKANETLSSYEEKLSHAKDESDAIIAAAVENAKSREREIIDEAKSEAAGIVKKAQINADQELKKARESIKDEIVDVSTQLTEKLLSREIKKEDHQKLIDSFIEEIGNDND